MECSVHILDEKLFPIFALCMYIWLFLPGDIYIQIPEFWELDPYYYVVILLQRTEWFTVQTFSTQYISRNTLYWLLKSRKLVMTFTLLFTKQTNKKTDFNFIFTFVLTL